VSPRYAVGVWVGNADGEGRPGLTGFQAAAPVLFEIFGLLETGDWFEFPEADLVEVEVCARSGMRKGMHCAESEKVWAPLAAFRAPVCGYCRLVHCDESFTWQVHGNCESIDSIRHVPWFVLPPAMEWYYRKLHSDYRPLPPFRADCLGCDGQPLERTMSLIHPKKGSKLYVPVELDGATGRAVFEAAHRRPGTTIFWHLDDEYYGATRDIHKMALAPSPGEHVLTLVDERGEQVRRSFTVLR
jgi:penicillin-binding protein 1C